MVKTGGERATSRAVLGVEWGMHLPYTKIKGTAHSFLIVVALFHSLVVRPHACHDRPTESASLAQCRNLLPTDWEMRLGCLSVSRCLWPTLV